MSQISRQNCFCRIPGPAFQAHHYCVECCIYMTSLLVIVPLNWASTSRKRCYIWGPVSITVSPVLILCQYRTFSAFRESKNNGRKYRGFSFALIMLIITWATLVPWNSNGAPFLFLSNVLPWHLIHYLNLIQSFICWSFIDGMNTH